MDNCIENPNQSWVSRASQERWLEATPFCFSMFTRKHIGNFGMVDDRFVLLGEFAV